MEPKFRAIKDTGFNVSFYLHAYDYMPTVIDLAEFINDIQSCVYVKSISRLRKCHTKDEKECLKLNLPKVSVSAIFSGIHNVSNIIAITKLIQIDLDNVKNLQATFDILKSDPYLYCAFISPSGTGIKIIFKAEFNIDNFIFLFYSIEKYFLETYNLIIDKACKNINRLLTISSDAGLYFNNSSQVYTNKYYPPAPIIKEYKRPSNQSSSILVENIINKIDTNKIDITSNYSDWLKIAFALVSEFGINGLQYFLDISKLHPEFNPVKAELQYRRCYKQGSKSIHIQSLYKIASWYGVSYKN